MKIRPPITATISRRRNIVARIASVVLAASLLSISLLYFFASHLGDNMELQDQNRLIDFMWWLSLLAIFRFAISTIQLVKFACTWAVLSVLLNIGIIVLNYSAPATKDGVNYLFLPFAYGLLICDLLELKIGKHRR